MGIEIVCFQQVPRWCQCCWTVDHLGSLWNCFPGSFLVYPSVHVSVSLEFPPQMGLASFVQNPTWQKHCRQPLGAESASPSTSSNRKWESKQSVLQPQSYNHRKCILPATTWIFKQILLQSHLQMRTQSCLPPGWQLWREPSKAKPWFLTHKNCEVINVHCSNH